MASLIDNEKYALYFQKVGLIYRRPEIKASLEVVLSVFTVTILIFAAIRPTLINITTLQKKISDQEIIIKKADNKIVQLINAQKQLTAFRSNLKLFDAAVPDSFSYMDSAKRLEYLAKKNNLTIGSLSFSGITLQGSGKINGDWAQKISLPSTNGTLLDQVSFAVNGNPAEVIMFLKEVENMDRLTVLNSVSLSRQIGLDKTQDYLKASGLVSFYFYPEKL